MAANVKSKRTPLGALVMLSVMLPGAGQLANGQKAKGVGAIVISAILFVDIIVHAFIIAFPLFGAMLAGVEPVVDEEVFGQFKSLMIVFAIAVAVWVWALFDTIAVGKRRMADDAGDG